MMRFKLMKHTHTPAPWAILDRPETSLPDSRTLTHISNGAHIVCTLGSTRSDGSQNHSANARLIAAAPELLSALNLLLDKLHAHCPGLLDCEYTGDAITKAEMAIAKAKGEA